MQVIVVPTADICWDAPDPKLTVGAFEGVLPVPEIELRLLLLTLLMLPIPKLLLLLAAALLLALPLLPLLLALPLLLRLPLLLFPLLLRAPVMNDAVGFCWATTANC